MPFIIVRPVGFRRESEPNGPADSFPVPECTRTYPTYGTLRYIVRYGKSYGAPGRYIYQIIRRHNRISCVDVVRLWQIPAEPMREAEGKRGFEACRFSIFDACWIYDLRLSILIKMRVFIKMTALPSKSKGRTLLERTFGERTFVERTFVERTFVERTFVERTVFKVKGAVCLLRGMCGSLV